MKLAFVAHSHGNHALLEQALITLVERYRVNQVIALESAADDAAAVLRARARRYPQPVPPEDPTYADFVLAAVLAGAPDVPPEEVQRTTRLHKALRPAKGGGQMYIIDGHRFGVGVTSTDPQSLAAVVLTGVERRLVARDEAPVRVSPGHLRAASHAGERASMLLVGVVDGALQGQFLAPDGARMGKPERLEVGA